MSTPLVVLSPEELRAIVREEIRAALDVQPPRDEPGEWIDAREAAKILNVCAKSVTNMAARGTLRSSRIGRMLRFKRSDVIAMLEGKHEAA